MQNIVINMVFVFISCFNTHSVIDTSKSIFFHGAQGWKIYVIKDCKLYLIILKDYIRSQCPNAISFHIHFQQKYHTIWEQVRVTPLAIQRYWMGKSDLAKDMFPTLLAEALADTPNITPICSIVLKAFSKCGRDSNTINTIH